MKNLLGVGGFLVLGAYYYVGNPFGDPPPPPEVRILDHQAIFAMEYQGQFENEAPLTETDWADYNAFRWAVAQLESGQNYKQRSHIKNGKLGYAWGKYQVLEGNIPVWTEQVMGRRYTIEEFLNDPQAQEKVFEDQTRKCYNQYHSWDNCSAKWFSGSPNVNSSAHDGNGTSVPRYLEIVRGNMRKYQAKHGDATQLAYIEPGKRILPSQEYRFPGLGSGATQALHQHCRTYGCMGGNVNNPEARYPITLPDGQKVFYAPEVHTNCLPGMTPLPGTDKCPHTGMSSFVGI